MYPSTKVYFRHLGDHPDEVQLLNHGQRMLQAVGVAVQYMDNLRAVLSPLADLHAQVLRVDPTNFPVSHQGAAGLAAQPSRGVVGGGEGEVFGGGTSEDRALLTGLFSGSW